MIATHRFYLDCICPTTGYLEHYAVEIELFDRFLECNALLQQARSVASLSLFQEELTQRLANTLRCRVRTVGVHVNGAVETTCECVPGDTWTT